MLFRVPLRPVALPLAGLLAFLVAVVLEVLVGFRGFFGVADFGDVFAGIFPVASGMTSFVQLPSARTSAALRSSIVAARRSWVSGASSSA